MTSTTIARATTLDPTFSFYVPATDRVLIEKCAAEADAVVVHGRNGPEVVTEMRSAGFGGVVLFDRATYERRAKPIASQAWFEAQARAGADRLLTPGLWVEWDKSGDALRQAVDVVRSEAGTTPGVTLLLALDSRWITDSAGMYRTIDVLGQVPEPLALVLSHRDDPLGAMAAVNNLLAVTKNVKDLTLLRSDH